ncbi:YjgN family protein [Massilia sp. 9096]|uniref:YjgN family protein n=1 Tax=Massilia sp. 9096 TaxID=1500894 RepID=UPI00068C871B|nr:YjgN family protein [Massilia sp. 9096]
MSDSSEVMAPPTPGDEPVYSPAAPAHPAWPEPDAPALEFSGSGAEYFRIWIVNLLLTVATLGIYSAWAKTRRLQYFYRNTRLAGASFDFHGDPKAILRGRILAALVAVAYHYAFGFSLNAGIAVVAVLVAGMPWMMRAALRFRLSNTSYRGLPFGFSGGLGKAYAVYLLPLALLVLPATMVALAPQSKLAGLAFLLYLLWPFMHGAMKAYQHRHLMYGDQNAAFPLSAARLAKPYLLVVAIFVGAIVAMVAVGLGAAMLAKGSAPSSKAGMWAAISIGSGALLSYLALLIGGLVVHVRMNNLAWSATAFPGVRIVCDIKARSYLRLQVVNVILILLTLGLFRPFAAVRTWRYRVAHLHVHAPGGFEQATLHAARRSRSAAGDGFADFLGVDLSW